MINTYTFRFKLIFCIIGLYLLGSYFHSLFTEPYKVASCTQTGFNIAVVHDNGMRKCACKLKTCGGPICNETTDWQTANCLIGCIDEVLSCKK